MTIVIEINYWNYNDWLRVSCVNLEQPASNRPILLTAHLIMWMLINIIGVVTGQKWNVEWNETEKFYYSSSK